MRLGKTTTYLIIDVATPEQANTLIDEGLLFQSELKDCELYHGDCRVTQCYNCQKYGHTARFCSSQKKCGLCAAPGHDDKSCGFRNDPTKHRCANCNLSHPAWSSRCKVRSEQADRARLAYAIRPKRYVSSASSISSYPPLNCAGGTPSSTLSSTTQSSAPMSSYGSVSIPSTQGPEEQLRIEGI